jgi:hypothetical protein
MKRLVVAFAAALMVAASASACTKDDRQPRLITPTPTIGGAAPDLHAAGPAKRLVLDWNHYVIGTEISRKHPAGSPNPKASRIETSPALGDPWGVAYSGECRPGDGGFRVEEVSSGGKITPLIGPNLGAPIRNDAYQVVTHVGVAGAQHYLRIYGTCAYSMFFVSANDGSRPGREFARSTGRGDGTVSANNPRKTWVVHWSFKCPAATQFRIIDARATPSVEILKLTGADASGQIESISTGPQRLLVKAGPRCTWILRFTG